jgi:hypothetical protein
MGEGMPVVRMRLLGGENDAEALIAMLHGIDGITRIEALDGLMPHMDDEDSSSLGLPDDIGPGVHEIEIEVSDPVFAERVRELAGTSAETLGTTIEFVDDF